MITNTENYKLLWTRNEDLDGYNIKCFEIPENPHKEVFIEIFKDGKVIRSFLYPAYKQYNLQAHFDDIVEGEKRESMRGYEMASWNGLSGAVIIDPSTETPTT